LIAQKLSKNGGTSCIRKVFCFTMAMADWDVARYFAKLQEKNDYEKDY
jgi:hypothetical protein